jgi:hypothetical protein
MNNTLFDYYKSHAPDGIPLLNPDEFKYITDKYGKDECRKTLAEFLKAQWLPNNTKYSLDNNLYLLINKGNKEK